MIASLPMYDRPECAAATRRLWAGIAGALDIGGKTLSPTKDPWAHWRSADLLFSQTCGMPFRMELHKYVHLVGTPDHQLPGCDPGYYRSAIIKRADDPRTSLHDFAGGRFALNGLESQSGWAAPFAHAAARGLTLTPDVTTGAHRASAAAVADGRADFAALDAVSWSMMEEWDGFASKLDVLDWTTPTPALPFVTAKADMVAPLRKALASAIAQLTDEDKRSLRLFGVVDIPAKEYLALPLPPGL